MLQREVRTRILLIRHAATDTQGRLCGSLDLGLSPMGRQQLQAVVATGATRPVPDVLFTSTLRRAREVADVLSRAWGVPAHPAEWAREIHCGEAEGVPLAQLQRDRPDVWARNEAQVDDAFGWPGGETYREFRRRILEGFAAAAERHRGQRLAIVTHAGVISQILGVIRQRPACVWSADRPRPLTATEITWRNGAPADILSYDDPAWY